MSADPVLDAHRVVERCFELGGCFSPASVRDQMLRACAFVQRAFEEGLIDTKARGLLVVGAGTTGLTAALAAAELGVSTTVIEKRDGPAFRLAECTTRDIDPTLYDWPADHWALGTFPVSGAAVPLPWNRGLAHEVVDQWRSRLATLGPGSNPKVIYESWPVLDPAKPPKPGRHGLVRVMVQHKDGTSTKVNCGALVSCVGWHAEITSLATSAFKGYDFWQDDPLAEPLKMPGGGLPRVLIAGGGDGALQDLIRITTNLSTRSVLERLLDIDAKVTEQMERARDALKYPEDVAQRALSWGNDVAHDDPVLERLEEAHERTLDQLVASPAWPRIEAEVEAMFVTRFPEVTLAHSRAFLTQSYPLNRFLTLLLLKVAGNRIVRLRDARVETIVGKGHACGHGPGGCHLQPHTVVLNVGKVIQPPQDFDVIVLRFGLDADRGMFKNVPGRVRHLLPYFIEQPS